MTHTGPYSPPKADIADAPLATPFERRLLRALVRVLDDEPARLARLRVFRWTIAVLGFVVLCGGLVLLFQLETDVFWPAMAVAFGGMLIGLGTMLFNSARQWPLLRRYLNVDLIRSDYEQIKDDR